MSYFQGEVLLAWMVFSDAQGAKRRPVLVVHDFGDADLLVVPITSHPVRTATDMPVSEWQKAGLRLQSTIRVEKLGTVDKSQIIAKMGVLTAPDQLRFKQLLGNICKLICA